MTARPSTPTRMPNRLANRLPRLSLLTVAVLALASCGGSDDDDDPPPAATVISGVAAAGAPLAGASVQVVDADAATADPPAVTTGANGQYSIDVTGLRAPLLVTVSGQQEGAPVSYSALVPGLAAQTQNTVNITPLTHAAAALLAPGGDPEALATAAALSANVTAEKVDNAHALVVNTLRTDSATATLLGSGFDPLKTPFSADGTGIDAVLSRVEVQTGQDGVVLRNLAAPVEVGATPAEVILTPALVATPTAAPTLPASQADTPTVAELTSLGNKLRDCLALPRTQRVTLDAEGKVTALHATCDFAVPDWKANGRTWMEDAGQFTFAKDRFTGATVGHPTIELALAPAQYTDPRVAKHPYCNTAPCYVVRYPVTTLSGRVLTAHWVVAKVNGQWATVGNQRPYNVSVQPRLYRRINADTTAGATSTSYFQRDRFESTLRLIFDLSTGDTSQVRTVRIKGPGLPAAGVVLTRSQRCGTEDRLAIVNQQGDLRTNNTGEIQFWTGNGAADFVLDAAALDGSPLTLPTPVRNSTTQQFQEISPAPVADQASLLPAWSMYTVEVFRFSNTGNEPDEILHIRSEGAGENAASGVDKPWPALSQAHIDDYLSPTGSKAGPITTFETYGWTAPAGVTVLSGYVFGQGVESRTNSQNETANYVIRSSVQFEPATFGDTTGVGTEWAGWRSGTSLSPVTASLGSNPNPLCTPDVANRVIDLSNQAGDFREFGLSFRGPDRKLYVGTWFRSF